MGKLLGRRDRIINVARLCTIQIYELCSRVAYEDLPLVYTNVRPIYVHVAYSYAIINKANRSSSLSFSHLVTCLAPNRSLIDTNLHAIYRVSLGKAVPMPLEIRERYIASVKIRDYFTLFFSSFFFHATDVDQSGQIIVTTSPTSLLKLTFKFTTRSPFLFLFPLSIIISNWNFLTPSFI